MKCTKTTIYKSPVYRMGHKYLCVSARRALAERRILAYESPLIRGGAIARGARIAFLSTVVPPGMPSPTTEPHPMPTFASTLLTCAVCGAFLAPDEQAAHLLVTSTLIVLRWLLRIRLLCLRCVEHDPQGDRIILTILPPLSPYLCYATPTRSPWHRSRPHACVNRRALPDLRGPAD